MNALSPVLALNRRLESITRSYHFIDFATQGYTALVGVLILGFHGGTIPRWPVFVVAHLFVLGAAHGLIKKHASSSAPAPALHFLRHFYPVLLYTGFYCETGLLNRMFCHEFLDPVLIRWEERLFGMQPSLEFMERFPYLWFSELLYASYFSYYLMIFGVGYALFRRNRQHFFHYLAVVSFVFYLCYLAYIFLPVIGPRIFFREFSAYRLPEGLQPAADPTFPEAIKVGPFYRIMAVIYRYFETEGAAFPSSHVAIALVTLFFSAIYLPRVRLWHALVVGLLCSATVYCRYHYVVDVLAGVLTAAVLVPIANGCYFKFESSARSNSR